MIIKKIPLLIFLFFFITGFSIAKDHSRVNVEIFDLAGNKTGEMVFPLEKKFKIELFADDVAYPIKNKILAKGHAQIRMDDLDSRDSWTFIGAEIHLQREILSEKKLTAILDLEKMAASDQKYRMIKKFDSNVSLIARQNKIDVQNQTRLKGIVADFGWPGASFAGMRGAQAAFLVLQHGPMDFAKAILPLLKEAHAIGDLPSQELALLEDRILVSENLPQLYGTQIDKQGVPYPISDDSTLSERRKKMGLVPIQDYLKMLGVPCPEKYCAPEVK